MQSTATTIIDCTTNLKPTRPRSPRRRHSRRKLTRAHAPGRDGRRPRRVTQHRNALARYAVGRVRRMSQLLFPRLRDVLEFEELLSCGGEAVARHLPDYDPAKAPFHAYIDQRLRWAMLQEARKQRRRTLDLSRGTPSVVAEPCEDVMSGRVCFLAVEDEKPTPFKACKRLLSFINWWPAGDMADAAVAREPDPEEQLLCACLRQRVTKVLKTLCKRHRLVVRRRYYDGASFAAVARELGITRSAVCRIHKLALDTLSKRLGTHARQLLQP